MLISDRPGSEIRPQLDEDQSSSLHSRRGVRTANRLYCIVKSLEDFLHIESSLDEDKITPLLVRREKITWKFSSAVYLDYFW